MPTPTLSKLTTQLGPGRHLSPAAQVLLIKSCAALVSYGFLLFLSRSMHANSFGQVAFFLNLSVLLAALGTRGWHMALLRFVPALTSPAQAASLNRLIRLSFCKSTTGVAIVAASLFAGMCMAGAAGWQTDFRVGTLVLGCLLIPLVGWAEVQSHFARGLGMVWLALTPKEILWKLLVIAALAAAHRGNSDVEAQQVLVLLLVSLALFLLAQAILLARRPTVSVSANMVLERVRSNWSSAARSYWISGLSNLFLANADVVVVGFMLGTTQAAYYFMANRTAQLLAFFVTSHNIVVAPKVAGSIAENGRKQVILVLRNATIKSSYSTTVFGVALIVGAPHVLNIFGPEFQQATAALRLLCLAAIFNALTGPSDIALNMCGGERVAMIASALMLPLNLALLISAAWFFGATGIAAAVLVATCIRKAAFAWMVNVHLGLRTDIFAAVWPDSIQRIKVNS